MRMRLIALVLMISFFGMQASAATMAAARQAAVVRTVGSRQAAVSQQAAAVAPTAATAAIDVPAGTKVQLNLVNPIMSLSTKPGDTVRAVVAFPVTVGNHVAIPAGTFVEGQFLSATTNPTTKVRSAGNPGTKGRSRRMVRRCRFTLRSWCMRMDTRCRWMRKTPKRA